MKKIRQTGRMSRTGRFLAFLLVFLCSMWVFASIPGATAGMVDIFLCFLMSFVFAWIMALVL